MKRRLNVLITLPFDRERLNQLRAAHPEATFDCQEPIGLGGTVTPAELTGRTALFVDNCPSNVEDLAKIEWLQLCSAGYEQAHGSDLPAEIAVCSASGVNDIPIAEWCMLMILAFARDLPAILANARDRKWDRNPRFQAEVRGRRVGILGFGSIGREVARLSRSAGLDVWVLSRSLGDPARARFGNAWIDGGGELQPNRRFLPDQLLEFLAGLDYLVLTSPLNSETRGLIGIREFAALPKYAVVLNPARAHIVDEEALLAALWSGNIRGAALDSHYREPMKPDDPFWAAPNTIITPHVSGSGESTHYRSRLWDLFSENVGRFIDGRELMNRVPDADWRHEPHFTRES